MNTTEAIDLIDLGVASVETLGGGEKMPDVIDHQDPAGLSDD
jgi:hypothetical protein